MIALRKNHPAFRMPSTKMIQSNLKFFDTGDQNIIGYQISGNANGDKWKNILVILNGNTSDKKVKLPPGNWTVAVDGNIVNERSILKVTGAELPVSATSAYVLYAQ